MYTVIDTRSHAIYNIDKSACACACVRMGFCVHEYLQFLLFSPFNTKSYPRISFALQIGYCYAMEALKHQAKTPSTKT